MPLQRAMHRKHPSLQQAMIAILELACSLTGVIRRLRLQESKSPEKVLKERSLDALDTHFGCRVYRAARAQRVEMAKSLLSQCYKGVSELDSCGGAPLGGAVHAGDVDIVSPWLASEALSPRLRHR
ncbi:hypothetical protein B9Z19DRAFT_1064818 [Tuber borchii]|uniref:Uncharacterized protein n=1 Tax=Tuber borchii TaxID=42251 RepID=A0A2T6ZTA4_TUBBO|nr:hypothetical protein B9Z19DRAFT_1064818 [Tuber borchii]